MKFSQSVARHYKEIGLVVLLTLPFVVFIFYTFRFAVNLPIWDDYDAILNFLNSFLSAGTLTEKVRLLFMQHNEHRILLNRVIVVAQYAVTGKVNFAQLIYIGNLGFVLFVALVILQLKKLGFSLFQLLPVPYLLFTVTHYEIMFFATPSIQYYWCIFFSFLFLVLLIDRQRIIFTCLLYPLAIFTQGGGLVLFPIGLIYLAVQKRWKHAAGFLLSAIIFTGLYFYHYHAILSHPSFSSSFVHLDQLIAYFLAFFGNTLLSFNVALVVGTTVALFLLIFMVRHPEEKFLFIVSIWILALGLTLAMSRSGLGLEKVLESRYTVYSQIAIIILYGWIVKTEQKTGSLIINNIAIASLALCAALFFSILVKYQLMDQFNWDKDVKISGLAVFASKNQQDHLIYANTSRSKNILLESYRLGVYDYKVTGLNLRRKVDMVKVDPSPNSEFRGSIEVNDGYLIRGWAVIPDVASSASKIYVLLKNDSGLIQLGTYKNERSDVSAALDTTYAYDDSGYVAYPNAYQIPNGDYQWGIMVENGEKVAIQWQGTRLSLP